MYLFIDYTINYCTNILKINHLYNSINRIFTWNILIYFKTVDNLEWSNGVYNKKHSTIGRKNLTSLYDLAYKEGKTASEMLDTLIEYYKAKATMN